MHAHQQAGEERTLKLLNERLRPALYRHRVPMDITAWTAPGEPVPARVARRAEFQPFTVGGEWGAPWSTTWFRFLAEIPERWAGRRVEAFFDLGFDVTRGPGGQAEGFVHDENGKPLQGLHPYNQTLLLTRSATGREPVHLLVEAAANPSIIGSAGIGTHYGDPVTAGDAALYRLRRADVVVREEDVWHLIHDMEVLEELMRALPDSLPRRHMIRRALEQAADAIDPYDVAGTAGLAREILAPTLARRAHDSAHTAVAVGHAHIDSAWLWPVRETLRKCARTFSNVATLAEEYPELVFACSSAQQYAWMKEHQPEVYDRIHKAVAAGNWAPVGGMWVEADGNLPGGEALARQLVYGRRFFRDEFGVETDGVWLPDSFGYTAAYPQLAALAGARWFLTQKLSWNDTNRLPHHTFWWEGIDGTRIFTHFPPVDTYNAELTGAELAHAVANYSDKSDGTRSLVPFGHGDGGGGPTAGMMERARRLADLEGSPKVEIQHPSAFFQQARAEYPDAPVWRGELYLETHRGTYTSQARTKRGNRRSESLLREAELWAATAAVREGAAYPYDELTELWKQVLLNQFHDILPGSSIAWVHKEAEQTYARIHRRLERLVERATGPYEEGGGPPAVLNAAPFARREVVVVDAAPATADAQRLADGRWAVLAEAPALGRGPAGLPEQHVTPVTVTDEDGLVLDNGLLRIRLDDHGLVRSAIDLATGRDAIAPGAAGNLLQLHPDDPVRWSAWNLDPHYRSTHRDLTDAVSVELRDHGPLLATVRVTRSTGRSTVVQDLTLTAGSHTLVVDNDIDWRERDMILKASWPLNVHAEHARAEIQFGHVERPTHENTSWDAARFEIWAHRWIHVGEHNWGVALATDSTYGHDVGRHTREGGGTTTTVRLSLLRAPHSPDPYADRGAHRFRYALRPGADVGAAVAEGYALNLPLRPAAHAAGPAARPLVAVDNPDVVVEAVKLADDRSGDVVVRLYESRGGQTRATLTADFPVAGVQETDLLEDPVTERAHADGEVSLALRPFQILTLRLSRPRRDADG
ncbi:glycoside hydrolase family 38 C-terminal domain-containing protein [Streptomyces sp. NPDC051954]|uniref:alpha-mannosidase n=1 Tax=Streptomyces sp. NPDC051954 TaxID=3155524 RepID=UPI003430923A